jgi:hypothetical protein
MYIFIPEQPLPDPHPLVICFFFYFFFDFSAHTQSSFFVTIHTANMTPELPSELIEDRIFRQFPGWVWFQRIRPTNSWIWNEGYDIQRGSIYRWVCKACAKLNKPQFAHFNAAGLQNAREHL